MGGPNEDDAANRQAPAATAPTGKDMPALGAVLGGRFQLEAMLGRGGTGVVFRAFDRVMGEPVAIKLLFPERATDEGWVRRLVREVKVARTIGHPNVRRIFEIGQVDGYWLITMELGTGTLGEQLRGRPGGASPQRPLPPWPTRRDDARAVVDGLAAIHSAGITHRDVTPNNVLRMSDGRLVISDFGLALLDGETTALVAGTPAYVAPEVLRGERPDQRSDVWQLGLVLHEIVFERRPRWDRTDGRQELLPPIGIDDATPTSQLLRILGACLTVDRRHRAPTAVEIAQAFEGATTARIGARGAQGARGRARAWGILGLGVGALAAAGLIVAPRLPSARRNKDLARAGSAAALAPVASKPPATVAPAPALPPASATTRIHVHVDSRPSHARVVDVETSEVWGVTPLDVERAAAAGALTLRLTKPRFESAVVTIGADRDAVETVELRPLREPESTESPAPAEPPATQPHEAPVDEPGKI